MENVKSIKHFCLFSFVATWAVLLISSLVKAKSFRDGKQVYRTCAKEKSATLLFPRDGRMAKMLSGPTSHQELLFISLSLWSPLKEFQTHHAKKTPSSSSTKTMTVFSHPMRWFHYFLTWFKHCRRCFATNLVKIDVVLNSSFHFCLDGSCILLLTNKLEGKTFFVLDFFPSFL